MISWGVEKVVREKIVIKSKRKMGIGKFFTDMHLKNRNIKSFTCQLLRSVSLSRLADLEWLQKCF